MLDLKDVTLLSIVCNDKIEIMRMVVRVMNYCMSVAKFRRGILMTYLPPDVECKAECVQIPKISFGEGAQILQVKTLAYFDLGPWVMHIHEDGFILDPNLWEQGFMQWDYIGAPWQGGVVGNNGFCMFNRKFMKACSRLPFIYGSLHSDTHVCIHHRKEMVAQEISFAPATVAERFSTETTGQRKPSFGFHGRIDCNNKYRQGWEQIEEFEKK